MSLHLGWEKLELGSRCARAWAGRGVEDGLPNLRCPLHPPTPKSSEERENGERGPESVRTAAGPEAR